jgi:zinc protease
MLDEGAGSRSAPQIADQVAQLGGSLQTSSTMDASQASAGSLKRTFPEMLALLGDVVRHPTFPQEEVERQRASRMASLVQQREDPNRVASAVMYSVLYGPAHPYGYTEIGTELSNKAMSRDDLQKFWSQNFVPNNAALIVSGQITVDELKPMVEKVFGDWAKGTPTQAVPGESTTAKARLVLVDKPGAPQTQLRVASIAVPRNTPDYEPIVVMNEILGGLFSSRINLNLREEHGYTYGASSQFVFRRAPGPFLVGTGVRTDVTAPAVSEIMKELKRIRDSDVSQDELTLSKDSLVRSLPADFETSGSMNATTANTFIYDLGLDYYAKLAPKLSAVTIEQVRGVAQKYVVPEKLVVVAVGDRAKVGPALGKLSLGATETWNADATPGAQPKSTSAR